MLGIVQSANTDQDVYHSAAFERHFTRPFIEGESDEERVTYRQMWLSEYYSYLQQENASFSRNLHGFFGLFASCKRALKSLGRLSHSWQDFFGHAINESSGFSGNGASFTASSDSPGEYWPSSYKLTWPWTQVSEHPPFSEPLFDQNEYSARRNASIEYVKKQFDTYLRAWLPVCLCKCYEL